MERYKATYPVLSLIPARERGCNRLEKVQILEVLAQLAAGLKWEGMQSGMFRTLHIGLQVIDEQALLGAEIVFLQTMGIDRQVWLGHLQLVR